MSNIIATIYELKFAADYHEEGELSTHTFASAEGAYEWLEQYGADYRVWYLEGLQLRLCDDSKPHGKIYYGVCYYDSSHRN